MVVKNKRDPPLAPLALQLRIIWGEGKQREGGGPSLDESGRGAENHRPAIERTRVKAGVVDGLELPNARCRCSSKRCERCLRLKAAAKRCRAIDHGSRTRRIEHGVGEIVV